MRTYSWRTGVWIWLRFRNPGKSKRQEARLNAMEQWKIRLTPQASTVPLTPHSLPLRISSGFLQVTESTPPFSTKVPPNRCSFLCASSRNVSPRRQMQDFGKKTQVERYWRQPELYRQLGRCSSSFITFRSEYRSFFPVTLPSHSLLKSCICREDSSRQIQIYSTKEGAVYVRAAIS